MAIATTAAIIGGISAAGGIAKTISGASQARKSRKAMENFHMQDLTNPYENLSVSTMGSDLQREESARLNATQTDALRSGGVRGVVGGIGHLQRENNRLNQAIGSDLDVQRKNIDRMIAQDNTRIRAMREQRDMSKLSGLGKQLEAGQQNMWGGIGDIQQSAMYMANNFEDSPSGDNSIAPTRTHGQPF